MKHHEIKTLEEIKKQFHAVGNVNEQYREKLSSLDRLALWITVHIGSMGFFLIIFSSINHRLSAESFKLYYIDNQ